MSEIGPLTPLDFALIAVCFISGLLAMYRGLTRELLSILSWVTAGVAAVLFVFNYKGLSKDIADQMGLADKVWVAQIVVGALIFLIVLIVVHLITARMSDAMLDSRVGMIDRVLGFIFGVARGFLLIVIPYMFYKSFITNEQAHVPWVRDAMSLPYIKATGDSIQGLLETHLPSSLLGGQQPASPEPPPQ